VLTAAAKLTLALTNNDGERLIRITALVVKKKVWLLRGTVSIRALICFTKLNMNQGWPEMRRRNFLQTNLCLTAGSSLAVRRTWADVPDQMFTSRVTTLRNFRKHLPSSMSYWLSALTARAILRASPFGRIAFANSDLPGTPDHRTGMGEDHRAVSQLLDQVLAE
jgi:hypothetical protein